MIDGLKAILRGESRIDASRPGSTRITIHTDSVVPDILIPNSTLDHTWKAFIRAELPVS
jgi:hypothetical protein